MLPISEAAQRLPDDLETCRQLFRRALNAGIHLCLSGQVMREYLVVATRRIRENGLELAVEDALFNYEQFRRNTVFLEETEEVSKELITILQRYSVPGTRIHEANIAAVLCANNIEYLVTLNATDFDVFGHITCICPRAVHTNTANPE
jgi:predicted nucleic acid-binding protein